MAVQQAALLPQRLTTPWQILNWMSSDGYANLDKVLVNADAIICSDIGRKPLNAPKLRLVQIPFAGYDWLDSQLLPADSVLCNAFEHEIPIAEYVMLAILQWQIRFAEAAADFKAGSWRFLGPPTGIFHEEAYGKTVGLIGYGHISKEIAKRAAAFGMRTIAVTRTVRETPEPLSWLGTLQNLEALLKESDFVVIAAPLTDETEGLINAETLAQMKPNAVLINVARGKVAVEEDLYKALQQGVIGGAVLDVWYRYPDKQVPSPRPSQWPFHELDNVYMTPHSSAWTKQLLERRWDFVAANLDRLARGDPLENVVN